MLALALSPLACVADTRVLTGFEISIPIFSSTPPGYLENVKTIKRAALVPLELGCSCLSRGRDAVVAACVIAIFCESLICDSLLHSLLTPICRLDQQKLTGDLEVIAYSLTLTVKTPKRRAAKTLRRREFRNMLEMNTD